MGIVSSKHHYFSLKQHQFVMHSTEASLHYIWLGGPAALKCSDGSLAMLVVRWWGFGTLMELLQQIMHTVQECVWKYSKDCKSLLMDSHKNRAFYELAKESLERHQR